MPHFEKKLPLFVFNCLSLSRQLFDLLSAQDLLGLTLKSHHYQLLSKISSSSSTSQRVNDFKRQPYMNFGLLFGIGTMRADIQREVILIYLKNVPKLYNICASHSPFHFSFQIAKQIIQIKPLTLNLELSIVNILQGAGHRLSHLGLQLRRFPWPLCRLLFLHNVGSGQGLLHARSLCMQMNIYAGEVGFFKRCYY